MALGASLGLVLSVLIGGVVADRVPQRLTLLTVEVIRGLGYGSAAVLALIGTIQIWHLAVTAFVLGVADGFFYPAYSAWLPALISPGQLLAANGIEGMLRPTIMQAAGPALASGIIAAFSPGAAFLVVAILQIGAAAVLGVMRTTAVRRDLDRARHPLVAATIDIRDGFAYLVRTRWLLATLLFATALVLVIMGPIEVLLPFAVKNQTNGGAGSFAAALAAFGVGGAVGSLAMASSRLPRRYLTLMILGWGVGCLPLAMIGFTNQLWVMVVALVVCGFLFSAAQVLWGTRQHQPGMERRPRQSIESSRYQTADGVPGGLGGHECFLPARRCSRRASTRCAAPLCSGSTGNDAATGFGGRRRDGRRRGGRRRFSRR